VVCFLLIDIVLKEVICTGVLLLISNVIIMAVVRGWGLLVGVLMVDLLVKEVLVGVEVVVSLVVDLLDMELRKVSRIFGGRGGGSYGYGERNVCLG